MRVAWDLQAVTGPNPTGLGASVRLLLDAIRSCAQDIEVVGLAPNSHGTALKTVADRLLWEQLRLPAALRARHGRHKPDMLYVPALGAPLAPGLPVVTHVHDLIPLMNPGQFRGWAGWYWERLLPATWRRSRVITVSNASLVPQVAQYLRYSEQRIHIVPYYADPSVARLARQAQDRRQEHGAAPSAEAPMFLTLASHEPRKNLSLAIRALGALRGHGVAPRLVCAGGITPHTQELQRLAAEAGVAGQVEFPGYLRQEEIVKLMLDATALLFISRYEGYGMPPQEAQSIGCPVVLSDIACHRAVYADPQRWAQVAEASRMPPPFCGIDDAAGLAALMKQLLDDRRYRQALRDAGMAYQATFSPQATATALREAFESALDSAE